MKQPANLKAVRGHSERSVLIVGDITHRDFAPALGWLQHHARVAWAPGITAACDRLETRTPPQVLLLAQARPGRFSRDQIEQLHARAPLARLVVLLGSWCEGETRTGHPWPGVPRIFWHQWQCRLAIELAASQTGWSTWQLPRTASASDVLEETTTAPWPHGQGLVVIHARQWVDFEGLSDACRAGGYATLWQPPNRPAFCSGARAVLFNGRGGDPDEADSVAELVTAYRPAPVIPLLDFLRYDDSQRMGRAGASTLLAKPFLVRDLLWTLQQSIHHPRGAGGECTPPQPRQASGSA